MWVRDSQCATASVTRAWLGRAGSISYGITALGHRKRAPVMTTPRATPVSGAAPAAAASISATVPIMMSPSTIARPLMAEYITGLRSNVAPETTPGRGSPVERNHSQPGRVRS
jgi:hypothetical protein